MKLDLVQALVIGRVRDREKQPVAALDQRQGMVLADQLFLDQATRHMRGIDGIEIEQRYAVFERCSDRHVVRLYPSFLDQVGDQRALCGCRLGGRVAGLFFRQQPVLDQAAGEAAETRDRAGACHID